MNILLIALLCFCCLIIGFIIGGVCGVKAEKREMEKKLHLGTFDFNDHAYKIEEIR